MLTKKDIKYNLISPFWLVNILVKLVWIVEVDFGINFSSQIKSMRFKDLFKLWLRDFMGIIRWIISGK